MTQTTSKLGESQGREPAWDIARLYPNQGYWSEADYLEATQHTNHLVELIDGFVEVLPMPNTPHQWILQYLNKLLLAYLDVHPVGRCAFAPLRVRLRRGLIREPDIVFMLTRHAHRITRDAWEGADLVMEIVSDDHESRRRDLQTKRAEYAQARIPEYWIIDPQRERITVLRLVGEVYEAHGEFAPGQRATSQLLPGLEVDVAATFAAGKL